MRYQHCIFDLYGTLVDIHTDEDDLGLWTSMAACYQEQGILPEQAVMIGNDGVCDITGARTLGLSAIYIRSNLSPNEPPPQTDYVLERMDLKQVQNILTEEGTR